MVQKIVLPMISMIAIVNGISGMAWENDTSDSLAFVWYKNPAFTQEESLLCDTCFEKTDIKCGICKKVCYCDKKCQLLNLAQHKNFCKRIKDASHDIDQMKLLFDYYATCAEKTDDAYKKDQYTNIARNWFQRLVLRSKQDGACLKDPSKSNLTSMVVFSEGTRLLRLLSPDPNELYVLGKQKLSINFDKNFAWVIKRTEEGEISDPISDQELIDPAKWHAKRLGLVKQMLIKDFDELK